MHQSMDWSHFFNFLESLFLDLFFHWFFLRICFVLILILQEMMRQGISAHKIVIVCISSMRVLVTWLLVVAKVFCCLLLFISDLNALSWGIFNFCFEECEWKWNWDFWIVWWAILILWPKQRYLESSSAMVLSMEVL